MTDLLHKFEKAGLGKAPFRCVGMWSMPSTSMLSNNPTAYNRAMADRPYDLTCGSCSYCGTGILYHFIIKSSDDRRFVVGSDCVAKTGDAGLIKEVKAERKRIADEIKTRRRNEVAAERRAAYELQRQARAADFEGKYWDICALARDLDMMNKGSFVGDILTGGLEGRYVSDKAIGMVRDAVSRAKFRHDNPSNWVGTEKKREVFEATVERVNYFDSMYGTVWIVSMVDATGNVIVSKSTTFHAKRGDKLKFKATVKEHSEYRGERQTIVQRIAKL